MRVLLAEDNPDHSEMIKDMFERIGVSDLRSANTLHASLQILETYSPDIFLSNLRLPDSSIKDTTDILKNLKSDTPIVVLTSLSSNQTADNLLSGGIQDYIPKDEMTPTLLQRVCRHAIQRKGNQVQLEKKNEEMKAFCEYLVHDFKTPLTRIAQQTNSLEIEPTHRTDELIQYLQATKRNSELALHLVNNLNTYQSIGDEDKKFERINANELFADIDVLISFELNSEYTLEVEDDLPDLYGNRSLLALLFSNVINNGIMYNKRQPEVKIKGKTIIEGKKLNAISIIDNGIGIAPEYLDEIFRPFSRLHEEEYAGSGLGLSIVRRIVDHHNSTISLESFVGTGSRFTVLFPEI